MTQSDNPRAEHRWKVHYRVLWPKVHAGWTIVTAEGKQEALDKVAEGLNRRCTLPTDWKFDELHPPEMVL